MPEETARTNRQRLWKLATGGVVTAGIVAAIVLWSTGSSAATGYGTAEVKSATVQQTLEVSGSVDPVHQAVADFQVAGTVSAVNVTVGQTVTAGEALATLDPTALTQDVSSAKLAVSAAEAKLSEDESSESSGSTNTGTETSVQTTAVVVSSEPSAASGSTAGTGSSTALQQDQQAVVAAQQTADSDAANASAAFSRAQAACSSTSGSAPSTGPTSTTTTTLPTSSTTSTTTPANTDATLACTTALSASLTAQQQVATDQKAVDTGETTLAQALSASASTTTGSSGSGTAGGASASTGTSSGSSAGSTGVSGTSSTSDTAAQLATDQAAIDTAKASLITSEQSLADAQLTAPLAGTVASIGLAVDDSVSAGSTAEAITIINKGSYETTASLTSTQAPDVKVGDKALVSVDGRNGELSGTVARVGPVDTSSTSDTYPLVVALPAGSAGLSAGSTAEVEVVLHQTAALVAVPTSAVHTSGTKSSYVLLLTGGKEVRQKVAVGVVGSVYTQITSGIERGQRVVLADFSTPVPTSSSSATTTRGGTSGFSGGAGGAGFGGGGFGA